MANYVMYRLDLIPTGNRRLENSDEKIDHRWLMDYVRKEFKQGKEWVVPNDKGIDRPVDVVKTFDNVCLLAVHNATVKKIYKKLDNNNPEQHLSLPHCSVVLDMRGSCIMLAIEKSPFFNSDTTPVLHIIRYIIEKMIDVIGRLDVSCIYHNGDFWYVVNYRTTVLKDRVTSLTFHFKENADNTDAPDEVKNLMAFEMGIGAGAGTFTRKALSEDEGILMRHKDYHGLVSLCEKNKDYTLSVKFRECGLYKVGNKAVYYWSLNDLEVNEFHSGEVRIKEDGSSKFALIDWIDKILERADDYTYKLIYKGNGDYNNKVKIRV